MFEHVRIGVFASILGLAAGSVWAAPPPAASLNACQNALKLAAQKFVAGETAAIGGCLQAVSTQIVKNGKPDAHAAGATCVATFRRLRDSRGLNKQLSDKLAAAITAKCAPGQAGVTHTLADILGSGAGVPQPLHAQDLVTRCLKFGGDSSVDGLNEWIACVTAAADCEVATAVSTQYPRVLEWLDLAQTAMQTVTPPATDASRVSDAVAALTAMRARVDSNGDHVVDLACSGGTVCGNDLSQAGEMCDGIDLNGQTCATQTPGTPYGTLACDAGCTSYDTTGCTSRFVDNGDGTVTDQLTTLTWEMKDTDCPGAHCWSDGSYSWSTGSTEADGTAFTIFLAGLNGGAALGSSADGLSCIGGFAGHCDWRLPSVTELQSILLSPYPCGSAPCIDPVFGPTVAGFFWTATRDWTNPSRAWDVRFSTGSVQPFASTTNNYVRAVRGVCAGPACLSAALPTCTDGIQNGDETDEDCGGSCAACNPGESCIDGADCATGTCDSGTCGGCLTVADCPPSLNECVAPVCTAQQCGTQNLGNDHVVTLQFAHDCGKNVCDGAGGTTFVYDAADVPAYPTACAIGTCSGPSPIVPSFIPAPTGTDCTSDNNPPAKVCGDPIGPTAATCVECNTDADCSGGLTCVNTYCQ